MSEQPKIAGFGQADPTDNRELGDCTRNIAILRPDAGFE